ncbi:hypothetical protein [Actinokineospora pegani]|uniref:hypothetical protein n=1 Tax=Actinokineospora pegani TaxID=2654637 RepID=UPI0012EAB0DC|nr:hypothetical protein [Actinokineospora pegani]
MLGLFRAVVTVLVLPRSNMSQALVADLMGEKANKPHASLQVAVERCIAPLKNWKILATGCRGRIAELPDTIATVVALEFHRLG